MTDIPEWAKPLVAARERGATLQIFYCRKEWRDETAGGGEFTFLLSPARYRIKPGTDPGERTADPLIFGASIPGNEPVAVRDEYVPLTDDEIDALWAVAGNGYYESLRYFYRAGWERRRAP